jgi:hypothetical protein
VQQATVLDHEHHDEDEQHADEDPAHRPNIGI